MDERPPLALRAALALALAFVVAPASSAFAQKSIASPSGYGTDDLQVVTLLHPAFVPASSTTTYFSVCCNSASDSYRYPTAGPPGFIATVDAGLIPNGARVVAIDVFVRDSSAVEDVDLAVGFCRAWIGLDGIFGGVDCPGFAATSDSPGDTVITMEPDHTVRYETDVNADGSDESVSYTISVAFGRNGVSHYTNALRLRAIRILYRRQVTPAPSSATFGDVPTSHPFFQFVEALSASGITAGCGVGVYCPDAPLTRGQMAVFLAKALGLHWPGPVSP